MMKKLTLIATLTGALLLSAATGAQAQKKEEQRAWGSWQLVSNMNNPMNVHVQFYNAEGVLMYEEALEGQRLNLARRKVCRRLDDALAAAYHAWTGDKTGTMEAKNLLARRAKPKAGSCTASAREEHP